MSERFSKRTVQKNGEILKPVERRKLCGVTEVNFFSIFLVTRELVKLISNLKRTEVVHDLLT